MEKKSIKRIILWAVGIPLGLIVSITVFAVAAFEVAPDPSRNVMIKVASVFTPLQEFIDKGDALAPAYQALANGDYERVNEICDSLEENSSVPEIDLQLLRSTVNARTNRRKAAEFCLKKACASFKGRQVEMNTYATAAIRLARVLRSKGDYKGAITTITTAIDAIEKHNGGIYLDDQTLSNLYIVMASSMAALGQTDEAEQRFQEAIKAFVESKKALELIDYEAKADTNYYYMMATVTSAATEAFIDAGSYDKATEWLKREEQNIEESNQYGDSLRWYRDLFLFNLHLKKANVLEHEGDHQAAAQEYALSTETQQAQTQSGILDRYQYLTSAKRWKEALDLFEQVDTFVNETGSKYTLDNINSLLMPEYRALRGTGQTAKAIALADSISLRLGDAIQKTKNDDAAELAAIYDTQQKEAKIAEREAALHRQRAIWLLVALVLLTVFFVVYTLVRRRIVKMKAEHERLENELSIARDIQMSMVPSVFPDYEGLDMYASMTPAKEVGGDLYGYVLLGDKLYFAVGDVSGKGVPASLFMAQATRLFRTLATQGMMPADICTRMNDALSGEDNESDMFVTFFLGLLDLNTGHLDFCNAGHNPPVVGSDKREVISDKCEFLEMIPNAPIGLWPGLEYEGEAIESIKGRPLFIYTDGLNEAENKAQEQFGDDRLLDILSHSNFEDARQTIEALSAEVEKHRNGADPNDDLTMMCVVIK